MGYVARKSEIVGPPEATAGALKVLAAGPFKDHKVRVRKSGGADTDLDTLLAARPLAAPAKDK